MMVGTLLLMHFQEISDSLTIQKATYFSNMCVYFERASVVIACEMMKLQNL